MCKKLTSITIPRSVSQILPAPPYSSGLFGFCPELTSISVDKDNPYYDSRDNCNAIIETATNTLIAGCPSTTVPSSVTKIGDCSFYYCTQLTNISIPNSVSSIGERAFLGCYDLEELIIPNSVTSIGIYAFAYCNTMNKVVLPNSITRIENGVLSYTSKLTSITIPNSVTSIGTSAFVGSGIRSITIPANVTLIEKEAFWHCSSLEEVILGANVKLIGEYAFVECPAITSLTSYAAIPPTCGANALTHIDKALCDLYVPEGSLEAYKSANQWKDFFFVFTTGLEDVKTNGINIKAQDGCIIVDGAPMGTVVAVYGTAGQCIYKGKQTRIQVPGHDTYIVKVGGMVRKLAM